MPIRLALSLHAADDALRSQLMPVNDRYPLPTCSPRAGATTSAKRRLVFVEYVMLAGVNDRYEQALALADVLDPQDLQGQPDPVQPDRDRPTTARAARRSTPSGPRSRSAGSRATVRLTRGRDIDAACGQLAAQRPDGLVGAARRTRRASPPRGRVDSRP